MTIEQDDILAHHGVKGMKWGVRNDYVKIGYGSRKGDTSQTRTRPTTPSGFRDLGRTTSTAPHAKSSKSPKELRDLGKAAVNKRLAQKAEPDSLSKVPLTTLRKRANAQSDRIAASADPKHGLSRNQKIALGVGVGALAIVAGAAAMKYTSLGPKLSKLGKGAADKVIAQKRDIRLKSFTKKYEARLGEASKNNRLTMEKFHKLDDTPLKIPKGTTFQRLTTNAEEDLTSPLYTTFKPADNDRYTSMFAPVIKGRTGAQEVYSSKMTMGQDILSPSKKQRVQILADMLEENQMIDVDGAKIPARKLLEMTNKSKASADKSNLETAVDLYDSFSIRHFTNSPLSQAYFERVKSSGYNAIVDDNDAGLLSETPMILLDAAKTVSSRSAVPVTKDLENSAIDRLKDIGKGG